MYGASVYHPDRGEANSGSAGEEEEEALGRTVVAQEVPFCQAGCPQTSVPGPLPFSVSMLHDLQGMMYKTQIIPSLNNL